MSEQRTVSQILRREGEFWTIAYDGALCRLKDGKGIRYLAVLLARPGERLSAVALLSGSPAWTAATAAERQASATAAALGADAARVERARVNVTRAIRAAVQRIAADHPALGLHLKGSIRTGSLCSYSPDPRLPISWRCEG